MVLGVLALLFQTVWVIDDNGGPGVNFTDLPPAVAAAADGDILDVRAGEYTAFALSGKGLRILGEDQATTFLRVPPTGPPSVGTTTVANVPAGSVVYLERVTFGTNLTGISIGPQVLSVSGATTRMVLRNVSINSPPFTVLSPSSVATGLTVSGAEVHLYECTVRGASSCSCLFSGPVQGAPGVQVLNGARVEIAFSTVLGGNGGASSSGMCLGCASAGGPGIAVGGVLSQLWLVGSTVTGGGGATNIFGGGNAGGAGLSVDSSFARLSGNTTAVQGGAGGGNNGAGGVGVLSTGSAVVDLHSVTVLGGTNGGGGSAANTSGPGITLGLPSLPLLGVSGNLSIAGGSATISLTEGPAAALFAIAFAGAPAYAGISGPFLGDAMIALTPPLVVVPGTLSGMGDFTLNVPLGGLPPGAAWTPLHLQGAALDASVVWRLSNGAPAILRP